MKYECSGRPFATSDWEAMKAHARKEHGQDLTDETAH